MQLIFFHMSSASKKHINFPDECLIPLFLEYPAPKFFIYNYFKSFISFLLIVLQILIQINFIIINYNLQIFYMFVLELN